MQYHKKFASFIYRHGTFYMFSLFLLLNDVLCLHTDLIYPVSCDLASVMQCMICNVTSLIFFTYYCIYSITITYTDLDCTPVNFIIFLFLVIFIDFIALLIRRSPSRIKTVFTCNQLKEFIFQTFRLLKNMSHVRSLISYFIFLT